MGSRGTRPRVLFVARTRYTLPLDGALARKWGALAEELDVRALARPPAQLVARRAIRRVDGVRTLSPFTTELVRSCGVEPSAEFPAYVDLSAFLRRAPTA